LRDWLYDRLAHNRLRLFGSRDACYVPQPGEADRFLS
jgi:predicted DCC family thiol-disulfide oxidoreductase YuxK